MKQIYPGIQFKHNGMYLMQLWRYIPWTLVVLWLSALFIALLSGLFIASGNYVLVAGLIGLPLGLLLFKWPEKCLTVTVVSALIIPGLIELYLPQLMLIRWLFPVMATATSATILFSYLWAGEKQKLGEFGYKAIALAILFIIIALFSSILSNGFTANALVGLKGYFQIWPVLFGIVFLTIDTERLAQLIGRALVWVGLLQIPFALHQFLVLVPMRMTTRLAEEAVVAIDVVAGTFGAMMWGGGRSTVLGIFQMIAITVVIMQYRKRLISFRWTLVLSMLLLIPVVISEIKAFPFFILLASLVVFRDILIKYPFKFISYGILLLCLCASLFMVNFFLPAAKGQQASTLDRYIEEAVSYNMGDKGYGNAVLNRSSVYSFWVNENMAKGDIVHLLVGYGTGATNAFTTMETQSVAATLYPGYAIGLTSLSALLWECGLSGALMLLAMIYYGLRTALTVIKRSISATQEVVVTAMIVSMVLILLTLLHVNYFIFDLGYQTILVVALGYVILLEKKYANT